MERNLVALHKSNVAFQKPCPQEKRKHHGKETLRRKENTNHKETLVLKNPESLKGTL